MRRKLRHVKNNFLGIMKNLPESYILSNTKKWLAFFAISLVTTMINLDITVANLAVASIAKTFHASLSQMQWVINVYMLSGIIFLIIAGRLADIFGRKNIYLMGIGLFLLASIVIVMAPNIVVLIAGRTLQGMGLAFTLTLGIILVTSIFPENKRGFALGSYMTVAGLAQALGPTVGGAILQFLSWRWIFVINMPLSLLALVFVTLFCPKDKAAASGESIDFTGIAILGLGLTLLALGLNEIDQWGISAVLCIVAGLMVLVVFYGQSKRVRHPLIKFGLFKNRVYTLTNIIRTFHMYGQFAVFFILPLYLQNVLNESPFITGAMLFCMTIPFVLISPFVGLWLDRVGFVLPTKVALFLTLVAFLLLTQLGAILSLPLLISALVLLGIGAPIIGSSTPALSLSALPEKDRGAGMGAFYMFAFFGSLIGVAISGALLAFLSEYHFCSIALPRLLHFSDVLRALHGTSSIQSLTKLTNQAELVVAVKNSFVYGFKAVMWVNVGLVLIALCLCRGLAKGVK